MSKRLINKFLGIVFVVLSITACKTPGIITKTENNIVPTSYNNSVDSANSATIKWKEYFTDPVLISLVDTALSYNQELNITLLEIQIAKNEIRARKGEYLPFVGIGGAAANEKTARYTSKGASDANTNIMPGMKMPDPLSDLMIATNLSWEIDIWKKLRNAKKSAVMKYLSSTEGKNFMVTNLIAEIANSYYELLALNSQLDILKENIEIQKNALKIVKLEKIAAKVTELAVKKFEAEVLKNQSNQFYIMQQITEAENRINFLLGRFPQTIAVNYEDFSELIPTKVSEGIPSQLLQNRPDIRQAEKDLAAAKLDVKVAKANFYPSLRVTGNLGYQAFNAKYLIKSPESLLFSIAGELMAPVINRNAIKAQYLSANAKQIQAVYNYERTILNAYIEVANLLSNINNLSKSHDLKSQQVQALTRSIEISTGLFKSARADYMEVLMTQRDALESKFELIETQKKQMNAMVDIYKSLGGGWQ